MKLLNTLWVLIVMVGVGRAQWIPTTGIPDGAYLKQIVVGRSHLFAVTYKGVYRSNDEGSMN